MNTSIPTSVARGFSLVELMVAMLIGMLVVAATGTIFISNRQTYAASESIGRIQENGRIAFELMARELREAGATPCGNNIPIANVLNGGGTGANSGWGDGLRGYTGLQAITLVPFAAEGATNPAAGTRVRGTDAVEFRSVSGGQVTVSRHNPASAVIHVNTTQHDFRAGDILLICDQSQGSIFQMTGPNNNAGNLNLVHNTGSSHTPGNMCKALSFPVDPQCGEKPKDGKQYADNATVARLSSTAWYVGHNGRGGRSLYRQVLLPGRAAEEVTEGVWDMDLRYLSPTTSQYVEATGITGWSDVGAVRIELTLRAMEGALRNRQVEGVDGQALERRLAHVVTIRGRNP